MESHRGKPQKTRLIQSNPQTYYFSPRGKPGRPDQIEIHLDELEALRLLDLLRQKQKQAAQEMGISQQTLSRIIIKARQQIADAIVNGKIIRVKGGKFALKT